MGQEPHLSSAARSKTRTQEDSFWLQEKTNCRLDLLQTLWPCMLGERKRRASGFVHDTLCTFSFAGRKSDAALRAGGGDDAAERFCDDNRSNDDNNGVMHSQGKVSKKNKKTNQNKTNNNNTAANQRMEKVGKRRLTASCPRFLPLNIGSRRPETYLGFFVVILFL